MKKDIKSKRLENFKLEIVSIQKVFNNKKVATNSIEQCNPIIKTPNNNVAAKNAILAFVKIDKIIINAGKGNILGEVPVGITTAINTITKERKLVIVR